MSPNSGQNKDEGNGNFQDFAMHHPHFQSTGEPEVGRFELDTLADIFETQTSAPSAKNNSSEGSKPKQEISQSSSQEAITLTIAEELDQMMADLDITDSAIESTDTSKSVDSDTAHQKTNDEFSDLLSVSDSLDGIDPTDSTLAFDLSDLFGEDFSFEEGKSESETKPATISAKTSPTQPHKVTASTNLQPEKKPQPTTPNHKKSIQEEEFSLSTLDDLFDDANLFEQKPSSPHTTEKPKPSPTLNSLFATPSPKPITNHSPAKTTSTTSKIMDSEPEYFEPFDELQVLLAQGATSEPQTVNFQDLALLIEQAPTANLHFAPSSAKKLSREQTKKKPETEETDPDFEELKELLEEIQSEAGIATTKPAKTRAAANRTQGSSIFEQTLKVPVKQLDNLSNLVGELVVNRNGLEQDQDQLRQSLDNLLQQVGYLSDVGARMQDLYERTLLESSLLASQNYNRRNTLVGTTETGEPIESLDYDPLEMDRFTGFHLLSQEMIEMIVRVKESASDIGLLVDESDQVTRNLRQTITQLQEGLKTSRMVPFARTADRLPVAVRRISQKLNKQASVQIDGRETLIDKMILEHLSDPMTHLVNNALYHGIESPQLRLVGGKTPAGQIKIAAFYQGNQTVISVSDDGAGIDPQKVKAKALERGLILASQVKEISDQEVYELLFHPGFSMKDQADDFAGRGVGMDVVRTSISEIRGSVSIDSSLGKGTTFTIRLPLTLSICPALFCLSNRARIAFPMDGVEDTQDYSPDAVQINEEGDPCVPWKDQLLPFKPLAELLSYNRQIGRNTVYGGKQDEELVSIVVLRSGNNLLAIQVDQVLEQQEIVIKQLNNGPVPSPPGIAGATILGDGRIVAIADVLELLEIAQGRMRKDSSGSIWEKTHNLGGIDKETHAEPMVLIVDDSITVRELLKTTFINSGYRVEQARDGQEAWEKLRSGLPCDIVFCDIEMPRMDGLELLERINKDEKLREIPIAMLTSRGAERHKKVAAERGASGYFTKPYTEQELLAAAQRMIAGDVLLANSVRASKTSKIAAPAPPPQQIIVPAPVEPKVLIVDDSVTVRELLSMTFESAGYHVEQARDGQEAWEKLNSNLECDLVFCDIEMPRMDGLTLLSQLQKEPQLSQIPVAMLTSRGAQKHQRLAAERGAKGYFTKPYTDKELLAAAQRLIQGEILIQA